MNPDPEHMEALHCALSAIFLEHSPEGSGELGAASPDKIQQLVRLVFEKDFSEAEFRQALDSHFHPGA